MVEIRQTQEARFLRCTRWISYIPGVKYVMPGMLWYCPIFGKNLNGNTSCVLYMNPFKMHDTGVSACGSVVDLLVQRLGFESRC